MLHNLFILVSESGISVGNLNLSEEKLDDIQADLLSSSIKGIIDFFNSTPFGDIDTFQFMDKSMKIIRKEQLMFVLVYDRDTEMMLYNSKLEIVAEMFENSIDWCSWYGNVSQFKDLLIEAKQILLEE